MEKRKKTSSSDSSVVPSQADPLVKPTRVTAVAAKHHDISVAIMIGIALPGGGQFYNGQIGKGILFLLPSLIGLVVLAFQIRNFGVSVPLAAIVLLIWLFGIIESALVAARLKRGETVHPWQWF